MRVRRIVTAAVLLVSFQVAACDEEPITTGGDTLGLVIVKVRVVGPDGGVAGAAVSAFMTDPSFGRTGEAALGSTKDGGVLISGLYWGNVFNIESTVVVIARPSLASGLAPDSASARAFFVDMESEIPPDTIELEIGVSPTGG